MAHTGGGLASCPSSEHATGQARATQPAAVVAIRQIPLVMLRNRRLALRARQGEIKQTGIAAADWALRSGQGRTRVRVLATYVVRRRIIQFFAESKTWSHRLRRRDQSRAPRPRLPSARRHWATGGVRSTSRDRDASPFRSGGGIRSRSLSAPEKNYSRRTQHSGSSSSLLHERSTNPSFASGNADSWYLWPAACGRGVAHQFDRREMGRAGRRSFAIMPSRFAIFCRSTTSGSDRCSRSSSST